MPPGVTIVKWSRHSIYSAKLYFINQENCILKKYTLKIALRYTFNATFWNKLMSVTVSHEGQIITFGTVTGILVRKKKNFVLISDKSKKFFFCTKKPARLCGALSNLFSNLWETFPGRKAYISHKLRKRGSIWFLSWTKPRFLSQACNLIILWLNNIISN